MLRPPRLSGNQVFSMTTSAKPGTGNDHLLPVDPPASSDVNDFFDGLSEISAMASKPFRELQVQWSIAPKEGVRGPATTCSR